MEKQPRLAIILHLRNTGNQPSLAIILHLRNTENQHSLAIILDLRNTEISQAWSTYCNDTDLFSGEGNPVLH